MGRAPRQDAAPMRFQLLLPALLLLATLASAAPFTSATVTEKKNDARYKAAAAEERAAQLQDTVTGTDVLRTGERSLAEIEFNDKTITRLGSKSVFSFEPSNRELRLDRGLALICFPKGAGGGRIVTAAITAAIGGTTVLVLGSGKIIFLEGFGTVTTRDGTQSKPIHGGQIALLDNGVLKVLDVYLSPLLRSRFIQGRPAPLPTWDAVQEVQQQQEDDLKHHRKTRAGLAAVAGPTSITDPPFRDEGMLGILLQQRRQPKPRQ